MSDLECSIHGEHESNECYECEWDDLRAQLQAEREARERVQLESNRHARACTKAIETLVVAEKQRDAAIERAEKAERECASLQATYDRMAREWRGLVAERDTARALVATLKEALTRVLCDNHAHLLSCIDGVGDALEAVKAAGGGGE